MRILFTLQQSMAKSSLKNVCIPFLRHNLTLFPVSIASASKTISRWSTVGIAGGEKFCYDGIFFKLATDPYKLYGGGASLLVTLDLTLCPVHFSIKAAGHELKAFNELVRVSNLASSKQKPCLHFPMITLIDYLGYRLVAVAALPISRGTLK